MPLQLTVILILSISFSIFLLFGVSISISMALASFLALLPLYSPMIGAEVIVHSVMTSLDNFGFLAIPFFVLAGQLMNAGGIARRLIELAMVIAGPLPGSLAYCNIIANFLFGAVSGSAVSSAAAVGATMAPMQKKQGYDPAFTAAINIASSCTGLLTPPSGALILVALITGGVSIVSLFVAGYIPALLMSLGVVLVVAMQGKNLPRGDAALWKRRTIVKALTDAIPGLFLIVVVMGGLIKGVFTPTEASTVSVIYSLALGMIYGEIHMKDLPGVLAKSVLISTMVLFMVGASAAMSWVFSIAEIPLYISNQILSFSHSQWVFLVVMNLVLLAVGTFMDLTPEILIFTPIFYPIALKLGIHPVHFCMIMVFNNCIGILTPPVGSSLFVGSGVSGVSLDRIMPKLMPIFYAECVMLVLVTFIPDLSLWLPRYFGLI